jgi:5-methylcytosine-specific restriction endonuclease McrA
MPTARILLTKQIQVRVFRRDRWLCHWCGRPVVFAPAMRYLDQWIRQSGFAGPLAYHDPRWRRDKAPLLDHLGAVIDHFEAHSRGGADTEANFVTSCNKCNMRKNDALAERFSVKSPLHKIRGKYGEPDQWDGFSTLFVVLAKQAPGLTTQTEREWLAALKDSSPA